MIKINLLPVPKARKVKKQAELRSQLILIVLVLVIMGIFFSYTWFDLNKRLQQLQKAKVEATVELEDVKKKVETVLNFEENKKNLEEKNEIIEQLKKGPHTHGITLSIGRLNHSGISQPPPDHGG